MLWCINASQLRASWFSVLCGARMTFLNQMTVLEFYPNLKTWMFQLIFLKDDPTMYDSNCQCGSAETTLLTLSCLNLLRMTDFKSRGKKSLLFAQQQAHGFCFALTWKVHRFFSVTTKYHSRGNKQDKIEKVIMGALGENAGHIEGLNFLPDICRQCCELRLIWVERQKCFSRPGYTANKNNVNMR